MLEQNSIREAFYQISSDNKKSVMTELEKSWPDQSKQTKRFLQHGSFKINLKYLSVKLLAYRFIQKFGSVFLPLPVSWQSSNHGH